METIGDIKQKAEQARRKFDYSFTSSESEENSFDARSDHEQQQPEPLVVEKNLRTVQETGETSSEEDDFYQYKKQAPEAK